MSSFDFIASKDLRARLDEAYGLVLKLLYLGDDEEEPLCSGLYRAATLYTIVIIEGILTEIIKKNVTEYRLNFDAVLTICEEKGYIGKKLYKELDKLRKERNNIHIHKLSKTNGKHSREEARGAAFMMLGVLVVAKRNLQEVAE